MKRNVIVLSFLVSGLLAACATNENSLRDRSAGVLGYAPSDVTITGLRSDNTTTYYIAKTPKAEYACTTEGGVIQGLQLGLTNPPICNKKE